MRVLKDLVCAYLLFGLSSAQEILTECGQTLNANSGTIQYKLDKTYDAEELCVFILRHNYLGEAGFRFELESHGINPTDQNAITIMNVYEKISYQTRHLGPPNIVPVIEVTGSVVVIIFKTYSNTGTGFKLNFKAIGKPEGVSDCNPGFDMVVNDETTSVNISISSNGTTKWCPTVLAFSSKGKALTDATAHMQLIVEMDEDFDYETAPCFLPISIENQLEEYKQNFCMDSFPIRYEDYTRGVFVIIFYRLRTTPSTISCSWSKVTDPNHI